jgi:arginase
MEASARPRLRVLGLPYHNGLRDTGMGLGPTRLLESGEITAKLEAHGWSVEVDVVTPVDEGLPEVARVIELDRRLAERVRATVADGAFPLVLAGNCNSCLGTVAGVGAADLGVVWFDAHADFDTPEDNISGFFDVMGLAILTGSGWRALRETIPGFEPIDEGNVVLAAVRDLASYQRVRLEASRVRVVGGGRRTEATEWAATFASALDDLRARVGRVYLHVDLDALDPSEGTANEYAAPGGLRLEQLVAAIDAVCSRFAVPAAAVTAYDPACDADRRMATSAATIIETIAERVLTRH